MSAGKDTEKIPSQKTRQSPKCLYQLSDNVVTFLSVLSIKRIERGKGEMV
jgi:hypothetical protein